MKKTSVIVITILVVLALLLGGTSYYLFSQFSEQKEKAKAFENTINSYSRSVYVAIDEIKTGDVLKVGENIELQNIATALPTEFFLKEGDILNRKVLNDIEVGTPIYKSMLVDIEVSNLSRNVEISTARLPITLSDGDFVDVRILFPNGEDYIVLSKKRVSNLFLDNCVFNTELTEEEIVRLSSAIIDTFSVTGTKMYLTIYVAPTVQEASVPTYLVRSETIDTISINPNLENINLMASTINAELRREMEERLSLLSEEQLTAVQKGHGIEDTASASVLVGVKAGNIEIDYGENQYMVDDVSENIEIVEENGVFEDFYTDTETDLETLKEDKEKIKEIKEGN